MLTAAAFCHPTTLPLRRIVNLSAPVCPRDGKARMSAKEASPPPTGATTTTARRPKLVVFDLDATLWFPEMYLLWGRCQRGCEGEDAAECPPSRLNHHPPPPPMGERERVRGKLFDARRLARRKPVERARMRVGAHAASTASALP